MMLEKYLQKGMAAGWLPTHEGGQTGTGGELSVGTKEVKGGEGIYLPFVANGINYVESQGKDVVSYNFTGCVMAAYTVGGSRRVCHVSTGDGQNCRPAWEQIQKGAKDVIEFQPHKAMDVKALQQVGAKAGCYGLITAEGKCYAATVAADGKVTFSIAIAEADS